MAERPTCATCPYWQEPQDDTYGAPDYGQCRRRAYYFPLRKADEWCGEHPDMPAWIARRGGA